MAKKSDSKKVTKKVTAKKEGKKVMKKKTKKEEWEDKYAPRFKKYMPLYDSDSALYKANDFFKWFNSLSASRKGEKCVFFDTDVPAPFDWDNTNLLLIYCACGERSWEGRIFIQSFRLGRSNEIWLYVENMMMYNRDSGESIDIEPFMDDMELREQIEAVSKRLDEAEKKSKSKGKKKNNPPFIGRGYYIPS